MGVMVESMVWWSPLRTELCYILILSNTIWSLYLGLVLSTFVRSFIPFARLFFWQAFLSCRDPVDSFGGCVLSKSFQAPNQAPKAQSGAKQMQVSWLTVWPQRDPSMKDKQQVSFDEWVWLFDSLVCWLAGGWLIGWLQPFRIDIAVTCQNRPKLCNNHQAVCATCCGPSTTCTCALAERVCWGWMVGLRWVCSCQSL